MLFAGLILFCLACNNRPVPPRHAFDEQQQAVIIHCEQLCAQLQQQLRRGGSAVKRFNNLPLIAGSFSRKQLQQAAGLLSQNNIVKDRLLHTGTLDPARKLQTNTRKSRWFKQRDAAHAIASLQQHTGSTYRLRSLPPAQLQQSHSRAALSYSLNNLSNGSATLHEQGIVGDEIIVAVIDSGIANNPDLVASIAGSVLGGENFVEPEEGVIEPSATSTLNDPHGTLVASTIAAHVLVDMAVDDPLAQAISTYIPDSVIPLDETTLSVPLIGTAPGAKLYALKTFPASGDGARSSVILAAMDRVLTLKKNFLAGQATDPVAGDGSEDNPYVYDALNIQVLNMSLGGATLFAGHELDELLTQELLANDIVVVTAAGNEGFTAMTGGSPGTGLGTINVGAVSDPHNERVLRELQGDQPGNGAVFRPTDQLQMAFFSSRGPTADGRNGVDIVANGVAMFTQAANGDLALVSGTSFSSPTVAGAAALLRSAVPDASAGEVRSALVLGADNKRISGSPTVFDQGWGMLNAVEALDWLKQEQISDIFPTSPLAQANSTIADILSDRGMAVLELENQVINYNVTLSPGQVKQLFLKTERRTHDIDIQLLAINPELPIEQQNTLFGDDIIAILVDAPTSFNHELLFGFFSEADQFQLSHPQPGVSRLAVMGDWTNVGKVNVQLAVSAREEPRPPRSSQGIITDGEVHFYTFEVAAAEPSIFFRLDWRNDWSRYPAHDLDLILISPSEVVEISGASLHAPEEVFIEAPEPGTWTLIVDGFFLHEFEDRYSIRSETQTGQPIRLRGQQAVRTLMEDL